MASFVFFHQVSLAVQWTSGSQSIHFTIDSLLPFYITYYSLWLFVYLCISWLSVLSNLYIHKFFFSPIYSLNSKEHECNHHTYLCTLFSSKAIIMIPHLHVNDINLSENKNCPDRRNIFIKKGGGGDNTQHLCSPLLHTILHTRHHYKHFTNINSFNPHNESMM